MATLPKTRLAFIDLLRGWAVLVMIEVHIFNAFLLPELRNTTWFGILNYINGLVAPSFIFISGFVFLLASQRKLESFRQYGSAFWKQISRILFIWIIGYYLHIPYFSFRRIVNETTYAGWLKFFQCDVLHCIAFGLMLLFLLRLFIQNTKYYKRTLFVLGIAIVFIAAFIWQIDFLFYLPPFIAAYINSQHYSLFPIFPWLGFMVFGGYSAAAYIEARESGRERNFMKRYASVGAVLMITGAVGRIMMEQIPALTMDVRANPMFFFERLGIVIILLVLCWLFVEWRRTEKSFVLDISRESLMVYAVHLMVIYGEFWNEHSLAFYYGKSNGVLTCIAATFALVLLMIGAAKGWGWLRRNHQPLARTMFWIFIIGSALWFFNR